MYDPTLGRFLQRDPLGHVGGTNVYEYVADDPLGKTDPKGLRLVVANTADHQVFAGLLNELCPEGKWVVSPSGVVSSTTTASVEVGGLTGTQEFCQARVVRPAPRRPPGGRPSCEPSTPSERTIPPGAQATSVTHRVSCQCVCAAVNADFTIQLHTRTDPGGEAEVTGTTRGVWVGAEWPEGYQGRGDPQPPGGNAAAVRAARFIMLGHELCGHAVTGLRHPPRKAPTDTPSETRSFRSRTESVRNTTWV
jgi:hypothetical protein